MRIRLAALIIVIATLILAFNSPSKSGPDYTQLAETCLGNTGGMSHTVAACTTLLEGEDVSLEGQSRLLRARGWAYYCGRQYDKAILDYTDAVALRPDDSNALLNRAMAYDAMDNSRSAEEDYSKTVLLDPNSAYAVFKKSEFDQRQGNLLAAISGLERVLEIDPGYKRAGRALADIHLEMNGIDGTERFLRQAKSKWPNEFWVYDTQVMFDLKYTGDHHSALEAVARLAEMEPGIEYEALVPALVHLKIGDEDEGIKYVTEYAERQLDHDHANSNLFKRWSRKSLN